MRVVSSGANVGLCLRTMHACNGSVSNQHARFGGVCTRHCHGGDTHPLTGDAPLSHNGGSFDSVACSYLLYTSLPTCTSIEAPYACVRQLSVGTSAATSQGLMLHRPLKLGVEASLETSKDCAKVAACEQQCCRDVLLLVSPSVSDSRARKRTSGRRERRSRLESSTLCIQCCDKSRYNTRESLSHHGCMPSVFP